MRFSRSNLFGAADRALNWAIGLGVGCLAVLHFPTTSAVVAGAVAAWWLDRRFMRGRLGRTIRHGFWWLSHRVADGIEATPIWVFVVGPRLVLNLAVGALFFWGLSAVAGVTLDPAANMREVAAIMQKGHAP